MSPPGPFPLENPVVRDASLAPPAPAPTAHHVPPAPDAPDLKPVNRIPLLVAGLVSAALDAYVWPQHGARQAVLLLLGLGLGPAPAARVDLNPA